MAVGLLGSLKIVQEDDMIQIGVSLHDNWGLEDVQSIIRLASSWPKPPRPWTG
jgi:hypothetical protein